MFIIFHDACHVVIFVSITWAFISSEKLPYCIVFSEHISLVSGEHERWVASASCLVISISESFFKLE